VPEEHRKVRSGRDRIFSGIDGLVFAVRPDEGELRWNGERIRIDSPAAARRLGVAMVFHAASPATVEDDRHDQRITRCLELYRAGRLPI
jgi:hypothetical protein